MIRIFFILCILFISLGVQAQISEIEYRVGLENRNITEKNNKGQYIAQKVSGKISGSGLLKLKNGAIYIGDFLDGRLHGKGIYIAYPDTYVPNCEGASFYVGRFKNDKKEGKGTCYDINGKALYNSRFENDKAIEEYPTENDTIGGYFNEFFGDDFYYIGEFREELPDGLGAIFFNNGEFMISSYKNGKSKGISVYFMSDGNWVSQKMEGENIVQISSSIEYDELLKMNQKAYNKTLKEAQNYDLRTGNSFLTNLYKVLNIVEVLSNATLDIIDTYEGFKELASGSNEPDLIIEENSSGKREGGSATKSKNSLSEQNSYNSDKRTYNNYDSMISQVFAGNRSASSSEVKQWQTKMKQLRKKWEDKGRSFPHSANESR